MTKHKELIKLEKSIQEFTNYFVKKYFGNDASDFYWVADDIGGVFYVNDYFFDLSDMIDFIKYKYTAKQIFDYYDYRLELQTKKYDKAIKRKEKEIIITCIRDWKKLKIKK